MATTTALATTASDPLTSYICKPEIVENFALILGNDREALSFVRSVILLVQNSDPGDYSLQACSYESIVRSALRAATLRVSVDPALRQAWMVPRKNKKSGKLEANLQFHYAEVRNRAMRSNRYWFINVSAVYEGEVVLENIYSGMHHVRLANGLLTSPSTQDGFVPVNERRGKIIGWLGYYKTTKGAEATVYMGVEDIEKFITKANPYWATSLAWKNNRQIMEQKTVLLALLRKADISAPGMDEVKRLVEEVDTAEENEHGPDLEQLEKLETIDGIVTDQPAEPDGPPEPEAPPASEQKPSQKPAAPAADTDLEAAMNILNSKGVRYGDMTSEQLTWIVEKSDKASPAKKAAARRVLAARAAVPA